MGELGESRFTIRNMRRSIPGLQTIRSASREARASASDGKLLACVVVWTRDLALKEPLESPRRRLWVGLNRGFIGGTYMWSWWKRRHLRDLPDRVGDDGPYLTGLAAGEFQATVMCALSTNLRHCDVSNLGALSHFSVHYGGSMTRTIATADGSRASVLEWIRDSDTLFRAHSAAAHDAESHSFGVGEVIELEFLRALAKRTAVPLPDDAEELISERRRDAKNLPTGLDWSQIPEPATVGGPLDGAGAISPGAAKGLRDRARLIEWNVILDARDDGAWSYRGILAGITAANQVPLLLPQATDLIFHQNRLYGSLDAALIRARGGVSTDLMRASNEYARILASARGQALLGESPPDGLLKADALARYLARRKIPECQDSDALAFFYWLAEQADLAVTPAILERRAKFVVKSVNRPPDESPDTQTSAGAD